jgi:hypothetical protein
MTVYITARRMSGGNLHEHIARVKWENTADSGQVGENSRQEMVDWIKNDGGKSYVRSNGGAVDVGVVEASPPYLRTYANRLWTDNLLAPPIF